jgi:DNA-binding transcriptional ArsR family regulator
MKFFTGAVFKAISDPTRRTIIDLLSHSAHSVKELTAAFPISQPAISQHLRELRDAKLVTSEKVGLEQRYTLTGAPLREVFDWAARYRRFFDPSGHAWSFAASPPVPHSGKAGTGKKKKGGRRHGG